MNYLDVFVYLQSRIKISIVINPVYILSTRIENQDLVLTEFYLDKGLSGLSLSIG
jgi:hypothetical protein